MERPTTQTNQHQKHMKKTQLIASLFILFAFISCSEEKEDNITLPENHLTESERVQYVQNSLSSLKVVLDFNSTIDELEQIQIENNYRYSLVHDDIIRYSHNYGINGQMVSSGFWMIPVLSVVNIYNTVREENTPVISVEYFNENLENNEEETLFFTQVNVEKINDNTFETLKNWARTKIQTDKPFSSTTETLKGEDFVCDRIITDEIIIEADEIPTAHVDMVCVRFYSTRIPFYKQDEN